MRKPKKIAAAAVCLVLSAAILSSCGKSSGTESSETEAQETAADEAASEAGTVESLAAAEVSGSESPYYGYIHATVLEVNGSGDSNTIYTFADKLDPENGWSFSRLELLDVETDMNVGDDVVILFNGDMVADYDHVSFLVVVPDGDYELRRAEGVTVSNLMSTFAIETDSGEELSFLKDNCRIDDGALSGDSGDHVIVYYADGGEEGRFPMRVFKAD